MAAECVAVVSVMCTLRTCAAWPETERVELRLRPILDKLKLIFFVL